MESLVFEGNKNIVGASSGGGVNLVGDTAGETFFVSSSTFKNVHVRNAKDSAWTITGTCFLNSWYDCSGVYSGAYGLTHNKGSRTLAVALFKTAAISFLKIVTTSKTLALRWQ